MTFITIKSFSICYQSLVFTSIFWMMLMCCL